jgi:hypothetical protein
MNMASVVGRKETEVGRRSEKKPSIPKAREDVVRVGASTSSRFLRQERKR